MRAFDRRKRSDIQPRRFGDLSPSGSQLGWRCVTDSDLSEQGAV